MKRTSIFFIFLFLAAAWIRANEITANYETIVLKDGTIINGYLKSQEILVSKKDLPTVDIFVDKLERTVPDSVLNKLIDYKVLLKEVDSSWEEWFKENEKYIEEKGHFKTVTFTNLFFKEKDLFSLNSNVSNQVKILERGNRVKYVTFLKQTVTLKSSLIAQINYPIPDKSQITGVYEYIQTKSGQRFEGVVKYLIPDKLIGIKENGKLNEVVNINFADIKIREKRKCNPFQPFEEQIAFKDLVFKKDDTCISGIICNFMYEKDTKESSLNILRNQGEIEKIFLRDILRIEREENKAYLPKKKIEFKQNDDVIIETKTARQLRPDEWKGTLYFNVKDSTTMVLNNQDLNGKLHIYMKNNSAYLIQPQRFFKNLNEMDNGDLKKFLKDRFPNNDGKKIYAISYREIIKFEIPSTKSNYSDSIIERIYDVHSGEYMLYLPANDHIIHILIK